ncbi:related to OST3-oligosaccharyltransferase gamma subunit [Ramularia collo-cygni]|uniref:Related to OST3-oligosaccharyltransferase gamma subunit n=1 Tax=Ramularia collo-cygni TaxID=112498 RepID=A0A2D3UTU1_9PEZI|nr:related to OST3-oligosaccharyltransferase gamma subunit [Ramularia collo-cygni]CZT14226.1 related to OST3-oligosaccharyltransferase gamma subunit [Ramularia collo-cygni]
MRFLPLLTTALLPFTSLAAKKDSNIDRFAAASAKSTPLKLADKSYDALTKSPRDYSVAVLLTAMGPQFGCMLCREFQPEWEMLAKSWRNGDSKGESRLVFGTLDFLDGKSTFQSMQLQTAPVLLLFHPTTGPHARNDKPMERLDFNTGINKAEPVHQFLTRSLPNRLHPAFSRPINYVKIAVTTTSVIGVLTFLYVAYPYISPLLQSRNLWAALSLIAVLLFTSGHMFNHIRKVPYAGGDGKGGLNYFAGGFQNQFGLETQIVAAIYGILSFATISLALKVPRIADQKSQQVAVFIWGGVILAVYSFLLSVFRMKNGGYPFWLPPF